MTLFADGVRVPGAPARFMHRAFACATAAVIILLCAVPPVAAAKAKRAKQVDIQYVPPKTDALKPIYDYIREGRGLERVQAMLGALRLPHRLLIKTEGCDGISNAWYEDNAVTICYEFLDDIWKNAATETTSVGIAPIDTLVGPFVDVVLHEVGHAVFDLLRIPLFGREEDAADQFSAYIVLQGSKEDARRHNASSTCSVSPTATMRNCSRTSSRRTICRRIAPKDARTNTTRCATPSRP
jgi:Putative metallopeptidase